MKYAIILITLTLTTGILNAQSLDKDRMQRDIEVMENILASLFQENEEGMVTPNLYFANQHTIEGSYLEGFGVLFSVAPRFRFGAVQLDHNRIRREAIRGNAIVIPEGQRVIIDQEGKIQTTAEDSLATESRFRKVVEAFAVDYAYLLRLLPPNEKVMIRYGGGPAQGEPFVVWSGIASSTPGGGAVLSAVVSKADLDAFQNERITKEQLLSRIRFTTDTGEVGEADRDLLLLSSIFSRLYKSDLSEEFFLNSSANFERIEGVGVVYYLTMGSKSRSPSIYFYDGSRLRTRERGGVVAPQPTDALPPEEEQEMANLEEAYPEFLKELKNNIIEYGSIVKNLAPGEALIFRIKLPSCEDCQSMPQKLEVTCRQATLENYRKNKITLEKAVGELVVKP